MSDFEPVETFDVASLEDFTSQLIAAGFEPVTGTELRFWRRRIHPAFAPLTDTTTMQLYVRDGWPVVPPMLLIDGLHANHLTVGGYVCLWHDDDASGNWTTVEGLYERIEQWCHDAQHGWDPRGLARDAQLNFSPKLAVIATFDLAALKVGGPGTSGRFAGEIRHPQHIELKHGRPRTEEGLNGLWFSLGDLEVPPRNLEEIRSALTPAHARKVGRELDKRKDVSALTPSGSLDLILIAWDRDERRHLLIAALDGSGDATVAKALDPGPDDEASLILRAGPDAPLLRERSVAVFGLGSLGGHVALTLAESGVGRMLLVDGDRLHPGNVVRHVVNRHGVGFDKVNAVEYVISGHAPWTATAKLPISPIKPSVLAEIVEVVDLIVDATGNPAATQALSSIAERAAKPLIAGALYRGGAIGRVQRQGTPGDTLIRLQLVSPAHLRIPPGANEADEVLDPVVGCSAPVNNAPPASVTACAALLAQAAVDVMTGRFELGDEVVDVYRTLAGEPPFDRLGRVARS